MLRRILGLVRRACCENDERHRGADDDALQRKIAIDKNRVRAHFHDTWVPSSQPPDTDVQPRIRLQHVTLVWNTGKQTDHVIYEMMRYLRLEAVCLEKVKFTILDMVPGETVVSADDFVKQELDVRYRQTPLHKLLDPCVEHVIFIRYNGAYENEKFRDGLRALCAEAASERKFLSIVFFVS